jgi:ABC-type Fe3+-hydroxamate transport system substrate-binding protein
MKIISVVPSLTELLFDLNLDRQLVGVTRFCIHPKDKVKSIPKIGGTKNLKLERIRSLKPDLIIANKEENAQTDIETLQNEFDLLVTDIITIEDAYAVILTIGQKTNTSLLAIELVSQIKFQFHKLSKIAKSKKTVAYLIWNDPIMLAGKNTFIDQLLQQIGLTNILNEPNSRYPSVTNTELMQLEPEYIFLSSEPFPFKNLHKEVFAANFPKSQIILVDGEMFSWYGSRMKLAPNYLSLLLKTLNKTIY